MKPIAHVCGTVLLAALAAGMTAGIASAQAANTTGCTPQEKSAQTLNQKMGQTQGVICPPDVDPAMKKPTPQSGAMPVIPPPGSPGGNPNVQPK